MLHSAVTGRKNKRKVIRDKATKSEVFRLAVIDLGTNSVRLDVYRLTDKGVFRTYRGKAMIRLGDGVYKTGKLTAQGMHRTIQAFFAFKKLLSQLHVDRVVAFGTSALRTAKNTDVFLRKIYLRTGIRVQVISGREEAELIARGIMANLKPPKGYYALVDIGGGSTEVSLCLGYRVLQSHSFRLGGNRLQQLFLKESPPKFKKGKLHPILALRQHIRNELDPLQKIRQRYPVKMVIGSSGTIRALGKILKKMGCSGQPIYRSDVAALMSEMQVMSRDEIKKIPGLEPKRTDLILPGAILFEEILYALGAERAIVSDYALRDGILEKELEDHPLTV